MDIEQRIKELERKVEELLAWKESKIKQQITYPLDKASVDALSEFVPIFDGRIVSAPPATDGALMIHKGRTLAFLVVDPIIYE